MLAVKPQFVETVFVSVFVAKPIFFFQKEQTQIQ